MSLPTPPIAGVVGKTAGGVSRLFGNRTAKALRVIVDNLADATKGVHLKVGGIELSVLPGAEAKIVFKSVFSGQSQKAVQAALKKAEAALGAPAFLKKLRDTAARPGGR